MPNTPLDLPREGPSQNRPSKDINTSDTARRVSATNKTTTDPSPLPSKDDAEDRYQKGQDSTQNRDKCQNIPAMSRLLDKTNNQMEAPENKTRRNVMAQLRSAFAMILADQTNPKVVLREPPSKGAGTASDQTPEPEPLIEKQTPAAAPSPPILRLPPELMIASQASSPAQAKSPTMPPPTVQQRDQTDRRTTNIPNDKTIDVAPSEKVTEVTTDISFAEFAAKLDARALQDLLEIAVVYLSFMKGQTYFSGPEIMQLLRKQLAERFDKDTSWKCFHAMRRDGKIEKLGPAKFRIAAKIGYHIEEETLP